MAPKCGIPGGIAIAIRSYGPTAASEDAAPGRLSADIDVGRSGFGNERRLNRVQRAEGDAG